MNIPEENLFFELGDLISTIDSIAESINAHFVIKAEEWQWSTRYGNSIVSSTKSIHDFYVAMPASTANTKETRIFEVLL